LDASSAPFEKEEALQVTRPIPDIHKTHTPSGPTIPQAIRDAVDIEGGVRFLRPEGGELFFDRAQLSRAIDQRAQHLVALGLSRGDRVGLVLTRNDEFLLTFLGALAVGVIPVPMYSPLSLGKLDAYVLTSARILEASGARAVITERKLQSVLWSLVDRVAGLASIRCVEDFAGPAPGAPPDVSRVQLDDVAFLQFTSGSTAHPKGVVVTHRSLLANAHGIVRHGLRTTPEDSTVSWLPLYHDMGLIGLMLTPLWCAMPATYIPTLTFVKHPTIWMETVHRVRGTFTFAPNFAFALARRRTSEEKLAGLDLSCLRVVGCGAEPNHPDNLRAFAEHFKKAKLDPGALMPCYGMAEATLAVSFCEVSQGVRTDRIDADAYHGSGRAFAAPAGASKERALEFVSCGKPFPGHSVEIVSDDGRELPERTVGEIRFSGGSVAAGYYRLSEATRQTFTPRGLLTGDYGYLAGGELYVTGRKKDIIILNGRNYDPHTIEWEVAEVPGIRKGNVVAFSRPGTATEELVVVAEAKEADPAALIQAVKLRVQESLLLNVIDVALVGPGQLPKTSSGKLQRRRTREQYLDGTLGREGVRTAGGSAETLVLARHLGRSVLARVKHGVRRRAAALRSALWGAAPSSPPTVAPQAVTAADDDQEN
jgi:fatty-acyl-CoA synthase